MAVILTITIPGMYISLSGVPPFRTPAKVDITKKNVALILSELKKTGITQYSINTVDDIVPIREKTKPKPIVDNVDKRLDVIEGMLKELVERKPELIRNIGGIQTDLFNNNSHDIETDVTFIPSIDTTEMKMEGAPSIKTVESNVDEGSANALKNVGKKGKYNK